MLSTSGLLEQKNLASDQAGVAEILDPNLVDPRGIALSAAGGPFWIADSGTGAATLYGGDVNGGALARSPLVVKIPGGTPTGVVFNSTNDFVVTAPTGESGPALFLFASKTGQITGWNPAVPLPPPSTLAQPGTTVPGAIYTGLAIGNVGSAHFLYAADFHNGTIDVFDGQIHKTNLAGSFADPSIPAGFAPLNVQNLGGKLYVTYAQQDAAKDGGDVAGKGKGFVDVFDTSGNILQRVASGGSLNAPWGVALAPAGFGSLGGDVLVGNLGDGHIEAFDPTNGFADRGQLRGADGTAVAIPGLRALQFGNGVSAGDTKSLFFTAGPGDGTHGLFGSLSALSTVAVSQFTSADGSLGLRAVTSGQSDTVSITDDQAAGTTTVVSNGRTQVFDHLFAAFDLELHGTKDQLTFAEAGTEALTGRRLSVLADLGTGENHFKFNPIQADGEPADIFAHSDVNLNVVGHNGNDFVNLNFDDITESRLSVSVRGIGGSKTPVNPAEGRDSITFGHPGETAGIRNSTVDVNVSLGQGNTNFAFNDGIDVGDFTDVPGPAGFGPSSLTVQLSASSRSQDVDNITLFASGAVDTGSTLNFNTNLGAGKNSFLGLLDAATFQIANGAGGSSGGAAHFNIQGGSGTDSISFKSLNQNHAMGLSGLLDLNVLGGSGRDDIRIDLGGAGLTDASPAALKATNRSLRLRITGGSGGETATVNLANSPTATFDDDIAILAGSGSSAITFIGTSPVGGTPTFGPAGNVLVDASSNRNNRVDVFGNFPVRVVNPVVPAVIPTPAGHGKRATY